MHVLPSPAKPELHEQEDVSDVDPTEQDLDVASGLHAIQPAQTIMRLNYHTSGTSILYLREH